MSGIRTWNVFAMNVVKTDEWYCKTCDAGPWSEDVIGSNEKLIVKYHRDLGHVLAEYKEPKPKVIFEREIWNDEDRENFKKFLREEELLKSGVTL
jgi:hypothetical protein